MTSADERHAEAAASHYEAVEAEVHHHHHPDDPNAGVVRGRLSRQAVVAAVIATAVTLVGVVLLAIAIGNGS
jgi:hypothetical protein